MLEAGFKERPVKRLPFPVLRCYWPKLAEEQEKKRVKGIEMYFDVLVFDLEPDLDNLWLEDDEPMEGILLRPLTWRLPKHHILDKETLRLIARSGTSRLTFDELKIAYPKLYDREKEDQTPNRTFLYNVHEIRPCFY